MYRFEQAVAITGTLPSAVAQPPPRPLLLVANEQEIGRQFPVKRFAQVLGRHWRVGDDRLNTVTAKTQAQLDLPVLSTDIQRHHPQPLPGSQAVYNLLGKLPQCDAFRHDLPRQNRPSLHYSRLVILEYLSCTTSWTNPSVLFDHLQ